MLKGAAVKLQTVSAECELEPLQVLSLEGWAPMVVEPKGGREKMWYLAPDEVPWLLKHPKKSDPRKAAQPRKSKAAGIPQGIEPVSRPFECVIEASVLRLARACGLRAPASQVAPVSIEGRPYHALVVQTFADANRGSELVLGDVLLERRFKEYDRECREHHTLDRVRDVLVHYRDQGAHEIVADFVDMIIFDAWTGMSDRHQQNWGIVIPAEGAIRLAPIFDVAACLGSELQDSSGPLNERVERDVRLAKYIGATPSGFGDGQSDKLLTQESVITQVHRWSEWDSQIGTRIASFERALGPFERYLTSLPEGLLPAGRKNLAVELLARRLQWLKERL